MEFYKAILHIRCFSSGRIPSHSQTSNSASLYTQNPTVTFRRQCLALREICPRLQTWCLRQTPGLPCRVTASQSGQCCHCFTGFLLNRVTALLRVGHASCLDLLPRTAFAIPGLFWHRCIVGMISPDP